MEENKKIRKSRFNPFIPVMVVALIAGAFFIGRLSAQVEYLTKNGSGNNNGANTAPQQAQAAPEAGAIDLSADGLKKMAKDLGMDTNKFNSCLDDGKYAQKVTDDQAYGNTVGVSGTPTFF